MLVLLVPWLHREPDDTVLYDIKSCVLWIGYLCVILVLTVSAIPGVFCGVAVLFCASIVFDVVFLGTVNLIDRFRCCLFVPVHLHSGQSPDAEEKHPSPGSGQRQITRRP